MPRNTIGLRRGLWSLLPLLLLGTTTSCAYTLVKKSEWNAKPKVVVDSSTIVSLRQQLADVQTQRRADSLRFAASLATAKPYEASQDSTIRARDAEIASLKDQLSKAMDQLDRIKRRLANPKS